MPRSGYRISETCNIGVGIAITNHLGFMFENLRNNPAVELMMLVAAICKTKGNYIHSRDYLKKTSIKINVATDKGNSRNEIEH